MAEATYHQSPFGYVGNNPVRNTDPTGMLSDEEARKQEEYRQWASEANAQADRAEQQGVGAYSSLNQDGPGPKEKKAQTTNGMSIANTPGTGIRKGSGGEVEAYSTQADNTTSSGEFVDPFLSTVNFLLGTEFGLKPVRSDISDATLPMPFFMGGPMGRGTRLASLVEINAGRELAALEATTSGAHYVSRHGAGTTLVQQEARALTGLTPDGVLRRPVDASRFVSNQVQLQAVQRAQTIFNQTGRTVFSFNMGFVVGEGYLRGGGSVIQSTNVQAIFRGGSLYTMFPKLR